MTAPPTPTNHSEINRPKCGTWDVTAKASLNSVSPHMLRHTACTLLLGAGVNVKTVSTTLGHEDAGFTLRTYAKFIPSDLDSVPAAWTGILGQHSGTGDGSA